MNQESQRLNFSFLSNNLFTSYALEVDFPELYGFEANAEQAKEAFYKIRSLYDKGKFANQNEHQLENDFMAKVLQILGWESVRQDEKIIQGKLEKPDFLLFSSLDSKGAYESISKEERQATNDHIAVILEVKEYNVEIDNKKVKDNPHFQILRYLNNLRIRFGFLSNARKWRFYDNSILSSKKIFYEVDLESILSDTDEQNALLAFNYFYYIFHAQNFSQNQKQIQNALEKNDQSKMAIESDLQAIIYGIDGRESLFEFIGSKIYGANSQSSLDVVYESSLYFVFRLLFIAYFEDKFQDLLDKHTCFNDEISLNVLLEKSDKSPQKFTIYKKLQEIFTIYNEGEPNYDMPVFNGGLFDPTKAPLLLAPKVFSNADLAHILDSLFYFESNAKTLLRFRRDYRTLSVEHLGTIYEGLLSYFFDIASEDMVYIKYVFKNAKSKAKAEEIEAYFDKYDYESLKKSVQILNTPQEYKKGQIYLKNTSNSRKSTASFYTPSTIASFLCESALENLDDTNILHFKILDNACGSGHFLIEALNQVSVKVVGNWESFPSLKSIYDQELASIKQNISEFIKGYEIDEGDVVKRLLLKRMIFGVDLNPFSIELTKLSLWIDSFIFGTPLSFIEHHIKCGNALIGTSIAEFKAYYNELQKSKDGNLFINHFLEEFNALGIVFEKLDALKDNTEEEIIESKRIYKDEIKPSLERLNLFLNLYNAKSFMTPSELKLLGKVEQINLEKLADPENEEQKNLKAIIEGYARKFRFFNYEIEFPEIVSKGTNTPIQDSQDPYQIYFVGFQAIVGNPPWDRTRFSDADFFPQFQSNYRTMLKSEKEKFKVNWLTKDYIKEKYDSQKAFIEANNAYYKSHYPLNAGEGDGNLFRFFVERNLSLLDKEARLNYVLPSALMLEVGSYTLRKEILEQKSLMHFYGFENREGMFRDVDSRYKFSLMSIKNMKAKKNHTIQTMFYKTNIDSIYDKSQVIQTSLKDLKTLSPNQLALQEVRSQRDIDILRKCYKAFPPFGGVDVRRELDTTNDSDLFLEFRSELSMTFDSDLFIESSSDLVLYEGKMIHQFDANLTTPRYWVNTQALNQRLKSKEIYRLKQDLGLDEKTYAKLLESRYEKELSTLGREKLEDTFVVYDREFYRLGFRDIASDTNERTAIFSLLPKNCSCGNTIWSSVPKTYALDSGKIVYKPVSYWRLLFVLGMCNSIVIDYIIRGMVQIHLNKTYLKRIPFPRPSDEQIENGGKSKNTKAKSDKEKLENQESIYHTIARNALILQLFNDAKGEFKELAELCGVSNNEVPKRQKDYDILRAKNDIAIAKLYGLEYDEFSYILESFKVLNSKQPAFIALLKDKSLWE